jgi:hypothetical protein
MQIHGWRMPSTLSPLSSSVGIDDTPFIDTLHGKPSNALRPRPSSAGNDASGWIAGLTSKPRNARSASACIPCAVVLWRTPCWYGDIVVHLLPQPTHPPTTKLSVTRLGSMASLCHDGGEHGVKFVAVNARVEGFGPTLWRMEEGRCVRHFVFGLHRLLWQHRKYMLGPGGQCFRPSSHPTKLPQLFNACTAPSLIRSGNGG